MQKEELRAVVRTLYDMQSTRIRMANRKLLKVDHSKQDDNGTVQPKSRDAKIANHITESFCQSEKAEESLKKALEKEVENYPIYTEFLKDVKGCGVMMSAVIISEIDIAKAYTRSSLNQYAGLNPGMIQGKKKSGDNIVVSDEMVRGDKMTKGFVCPYNKFLKTKLLGVLAGCMLKSKSSYTKYYYDYKSRLENEAGWKDESAGHRDNASKRYMIKMFLSDLYEKWRTLEGLEVRVPYAEEYLNHTHHTKEIA